MHRRALDGYEKVLGKEHPHTLTSVHCFAYMLQSKEKYHDASLLYQRACTGYEKILGLNHHTTKACAKDYSAMLDSI